MNEDVPSLKLTFSHLKMDGWNTSFLLGWPIFPGLCQFQGVHFLLKMGFFQCHASFQGCIWGVVAEKP